MGALCAVAVGSDTHTDLCSFFFFAVRLALLSQILATFFEVFCVGYRTDLAEVFLDVLKRYLCINKGPEES